MLADDSASSTIVWAADLNLREFVTPGFHPFWEDALRRPGRNVRWAIAVTDDAVADRCEGAPRPLPPLQAGCPRRPVHPRPAYG